MTWLFKIGPIQALLIMMTIVYLETGKEFLLKKEIPNVFEGKRPLQAEYFYVMLS